MMGEFKEHRIVYGLTDYEVSVLQGALRERGENWSEDKQTTDSLEQILLDQLGAETADGTGWEVLKGS